MSRKWESNVFGNQTFLGSRDRDDSNTALFASIAEKKIFDEFDVHHVYKVGIKRLWAYEAEMTLTPISSLESAKKKFLMNSTYIMSRKWESNLFGNKTFLGSGGRDDSNTALFTSIAEKKIFDELDVHDV